VDEFLDPGLVVEHAAEAGQHVEVVTIVLGGVEEKQVRQFFVRGPEDHPPARPADDQDGLGDGIGQGAARVRDGDAALNGRTAQFLASHDGFEQVLVVVNESRLLGHGDQFSQRAVLGA